MSNSQYHPLSIKDNDNFNEYKKHIVGGVNSPVRAFGSVGGDPVIVASAKGAKIKDVHGKEYIDYVTSWGALILGHTDSRVNGAISEALERGSSYGCPTPTELELAKKIKSFFPSIELIRMVNSGTEATMSAIRVARAFTKRDKIIKFEGCYHGHSDYLLVKAGSGALTLGTPSSAGVPADFAKHTLVATYNDIESVKKLFNEYKNEIACIIVEPIAGNMGLVIPTPEFLHGLKSECDKNGALLIFDEVITGFRLGEHGGGVQELYGIKPDLTTMGKILGAGMPVGAYGGRADVMSLLSPMGGVYQAGTLSGNPLVMSAGLAVLDVLSAPGFYKKLNAKASVLHKLFSDNLKALGLKYYTDSIASMSCMFFTEKTVNSYATAMTSDSKRYAEFFHRMLKEGIYLAPSQFEVTFVSEAHSEADIEFTAKAHYNVLKDMM